MSVGTNQSNKTPPEVSGGPTREFILSDIYTIVELRRKLELRRLG